MAATLTKNPARQLLSDATLADGSVVDVVIDGNGDISEITPAASRSATADTSIDVRHDLSGRMLLPAPVEPHAHLDKAFLAETIVNPTGDLIGAIEAMRANRHLLTVDETVERAERAARLMAANGYVAVRTHADVTSEHGLTSIEALSEVKSRLVDVIDIEIAALCGWPVTGAVGADQRALLRAAVETGADLVGGCPHLEHLRGDGTIESATEIFLQVAADNGLPVDLHTDETLDPASNGLDVLARHVLAGFDQPVTASHCVSLGQRPMAEQQATSEQVAAAGISVVALPHTNLFLQGRGSTPMPRALTGVEALRRAGANVAAGADNLQDPFNPVGRACAFETAGLMIMTTHLLAPDAWATVSTKSAAALRRAGAAGLVVGAPADLLAIPAHTVREAIATAPSDRWRWRAGRTSTEM